MKLGWPVTLVVAAFLEEIGWRGYLQPVMVDRFGIRRGIFLVGLVWAAFHLSGDLSGKAVLSTAVTSLAARLAFCLILSVVFGWLRLRSRSFLPVAVAHAAYNFLIQIVERSQLPLKLPGATWATLAAWAVIGYLLFRHWAPQTVDRPPAENSASWSAARITS
jgi:membrane protease YdiL (CAAX protease family)